MFASVDWEETVETKKYKSPSPGFTPSSPRCTQLGRTQ